ncbi:MAG: hypothetical protein QOI20_556 [Acidimicrobiaceae bacterium]|nr:hypothetical protein [Acidimicrobiaceae bacterium]
MLLFDALRMADREWSRKIGRAAISIQYEMVRLADNALVDGAFWPGPAEPEPEALGIDLVQVHCECPSEIAPGRYYRRVPERHRGFREEAVELADYEAYRPLAKPLKLVAPLVRVDTSAPVEPESLVNAVALEFRRSSG